MNKVIRVLFDKVRDLPDWLRGEFSARHPNAGFRRYCGMKTVLLIVIVAAIVYYIGREVLGSFRHPDDEDLLDYWNGVTGQQNRSAYRQISEHLATCEKCRDRLDELRKRPGGPGAGEPLIRRRY